MNALKQFYHPQSKSAVVCEGDAIEGRWRCQSDSLAVYDCERYHKFRNTLMDAGYCEL